MKIGYGTSFDGKLANFPNTSVKTTICIVGTISAQATPMKVCL